MSFDPIHLYWLGGLLLLFLPVELWAALATPGRTDTFSELVWFAFGVRPRADGSKVRWAPLRRLILVGMTVSLTLHFVLATSAVPVGIFGAGVAAVLIRAVGWERGQ